jgi:hypothetical protein
VLALRKLLADPSRKLRLSAALSLHELGDREASARRSCAVLRGAEAPDRAVGRRFDPRPPAGSALWQRAPAPSSTCLGVRLDPGEGLA